MTLPKGTLHVEESKTKQQGYTVEGQLEKRNSYIIWC